MTRTLATSVEFAGHVRRMQLRHIRQSLEVREYEARQIQKGVECEKVLR